MNADDRSLLALLEENQRKAPEYFAPYQCDDERGIRACV